MTGTLITARYILVHQGDGHRMLRDGAVLVRGTQIEWVGPTGDAPAAVQRIFDRLKASYSERTAGTGRELFPPVFPEVGPVESRADLVDDPLRS